jgi:hypothetical protein
MAIGYVWDGKNCPRDNCEGELQQQDEANVMCLACERVWFHYRRARQHTLANQDGENVATLTT